MAPAALEADRLAPPPARFDSTATAAASLVPDDSIRATGRAIVDGTDGSAAWWTSFEDAALNRLVDSVLVGNRDLHVAEARLREVQQRYRISRAEQFPSVFRTAESSRQSVPSNTGSTASLSESVPTFPDRIDVTTYSASLGFSWELDLWGRARDTKRAAIADYLTMEAERDLAQVGVVSETISAYADLADAREQLRIAEANVQLLTERVAVTEERFERGVTSSFELYRIVQSLEEARASLPQIEASIYQIEGRLATLTGRFRSDAAALVAEVRLPESPATIPGGLPSDLLFARPDIVAAEGRMEAARLRAGVAEASRRPTFVLTAAGGTQSDALSGLKDSGQRFGTLAGSLTAPVFNAGALKASSRAAMEQYRAAVASYDQAVLNAVIEVESALVSYGAERRRLAALEEAVAHAEASYASQRDRYVGGMGDYGAFLDAELNLLAAQASLAGGRRSLALAHLSVHRALGGSWVSPAEV